MCTRRLRACFIFKGFFIFIRWPVWTSRPWFVTIFRIIELFSFAVLPVFLWMTVLTFLSAAFLSLMRIAEWRLRQTEFCVFFLITSSADLVAIWGRQIRMPFSDFIMLGLWGFREFRVVFFSFTVRTRAVTFYVWTPVIFWFFNFVWFYFFKVPCGTVNFLCTWL